jgi:predicted peroxiredoxin
MKRFGWTILLGLAVLAGIVMTQISPVFAQMQGGNHAQMAAATNGAKMVHLTHGLDEPRATFMTLNLVNDLRERGADVTLLLTMEGTQLADAGKSLEIRQSNEKESLAQLYDKFVAQGGKVKVCPDCAAAAGITNSLRTGAQLAIGNGDIPSLLMTSGSAIDF